MMPDFVYQVGKVKFQPDDLLVCYTDGVNEALSLEEEEFGEERLKELILKHRKLDSQQLSDKIISEIYNFCEGAPQYDDITLLTTKRLA